MDRTIFSYIEFLDMVVSICLLLPTKDVIRTSTEHGPVDPFASHDCCFDMQLGSPLPALKWRANVLLQLVFSQRLFVC